MGLENSQKNENYQHFEIFDRYGSKSSMQIIQYESAISGVATSIRSCRYNAIIIDQRHNRNAHPPEVSLFFLEAFLS